MKPLILKVDKDGKPLVTAEDIQHMVELAYNEGVKDGSKANVITVPSTSPSTSPTWPPITWNEITTTPLDNPIYKTVVTCETKGGYNA